MPTLLLSARQTDDSQKLWRACIAANWDVVRVHGWKVPSVPAQEIAVYGEPLFASLVAQTLKLQLLEPQLDWLPRLPRQWRGREVRLTTLADARTLQERAFIKPADDKCFEARVYESGSELPPPGPLPEDLPVLVQGIVHWTVEYRCFVADRAVATASAYWRDGALPKAEDGTWIEREPELQAAIQFCQQFMADPAVSVPDAAVVDVGIIENCGWGVVECNAAWASGTYGCDPFEVLHVVKRACRQKSAA